MHPSHRLPHIAPDIASLTLVSPSHRTQLAAPAPSPSRGGIALQRIQLSFSVLGPPAPASGTGLQRQRQRISSNSQRIQLQLEAPASSSCFASSLSYHLAPPGLAFSEKARSASRASASQLQFAAHPAPARTSAFSPHQRLFISKDLALTWSL